MRRTSKTRRFPTPILTAKRTIPPIFSNFYNSYYSIAAEMDKYLEEMEVYLDNYYNGDYKAGVADTAKIEQDFRARIKRFKDKRFKNETQIQKGLKDELTPHRKLPQGS